MRKAGPQFETVQEWNSKFVCEGDLAVTSVTPLITRVDVGDLAGEAGVPFFPHRSMCVPPEAVRLVE